jgi:hypothetical protein
MGQGKTRKNRLTLTTTQAQTATNYPSARRVQRKLRSVRTFTLFGSKRVEGKCLKRTSPAKPESAPEC